MEFKSLLDFAELGHALSPEAYDAVVPSLREGLILAQQELGRNRSAAIVILMAGVFAAGKSEAVNKLLDWMDPRFIETSSFTDKAEQGHRYPPLWHYWRHLPARGRIGIFFEHWYSDLIETRSRGTIEEGAFEAELERLNRFERMLIDEGVVLIKVTLHISEQHQRKRVKKLEADPDTSWRVHDEDKASLRHYKSLRAALGQIMAATGTESAPWTAIEAEDRRYRDVTFAELVLTTIRKSFEPACEPELGSPPPAIGTALSVLAGLDFSKSHNKRTYKDDLESVQGRLARLLRDTRFRKRSMILAFEGTDAAGKGGAIRRVAAAMDPCQYRIFPIAAPNDNERLHPFLWRFWQHVPAQGHVTIFDRTWYGRVLVERVEQLTSVTAGQRAYDEINDFEAELDQARCIVLKFWLAISKDEQLRRFEARKSTPFKQFKITPEDWRNREKWEAYEAAVTEMVARTGTAHAPWMLIETEDKRYGRIKILKTICDRLEKSFDTA